MSTIFYDHLLSLEELEKLIAQISQIPEEKEELWQIIDEIMHHSVFECILDTLPTEHHEEFLGKFAEIPHDHGLIAYLTDKSGNDIELVITKQIENISSEILNEILEE